MQASTAPPPYANDEEEKHYCCCAMHVRQAATVIAIVFIVFDVLSLGGFNLSALIGIAIYALVIYGDKKERAWAYLPSLVLQAIGVVGAALVPIVLLVIFVALFFIEKPQEPSDFIHSIIDHDHVTPETEQRIREFMELIWPTLQISLAVLFVVAMAFVGLQFWLWHITLRAYRYMRDVVEPRKCQQTSYAALGVTAASREKDCNAFKV